MTTSVHHDSKRGNLDYGNLGTSITASPCRFNPNSENFLPKDIIKAIFKYLDYVSRIRFTQTSKSWTFLKMLPDVAPLHPDLVELFKEHNNGLSPFFLTKMNPQISSSNSKHITVSTGYESNSLPIICFHFKGREGFSFKDEQSGQLLLKGEDFKGEFCIQYIKGEWHYFVTDHSGLFERLFEGLVNHDKTNNKEINLKSTSYTELKEELKWLALKYFLGSKIFQDKPILRENTSCTIQ